jgi:hypothetical protein
MRIHIAPTESVGGFAGFMEVPDQCRSRGAPSRTKSWQPAPLPAKRPVDATGPRPPSRRDLLERQRFRIEGGLGGQDAGRLHVAHVAVQMMDNVVEPAVKVGGPPRSNGSAGVRRGTRCGGHRLRDRGSDTRPRLGGTPAAARHPRVPGGCRIWQSRRDRRQTDS